MNSVHPLPCHVMFHSPTSVSPQSISTFHHKGTTCHLLLLVRPTPAPPCSIHGAPTRLLPFGATPHLPHSSTTPNLNPLLPHCRRHGELPVPRWAPIAKLPRPLPVVVAYTGEFLSPPSCLCSPSFRLPPPVHRRPFPLPVVDHHAPPLGRPGAA